MNIPQSFLIILALAFAALARGQTLEVLHSFNTLDDAGLAELVQGSDGNLYGSTPHGIFKILPDGTFISLLSSQAFSGLISGGLVEGNDGEFYGTEVAGGTNFFGAVFKVTMDGGTLTRLAEFNGLEGKYPNSGVVLGRDANFYGTTQNGGTYDEGTVFRMTPEGVLTTLGSLRGGPLARLAEGKDGAFYGTTGGLYGGDGTVFRITTNGVLTTLTVFKGGNGAVPWGQLLPGADGRLYGTTSMGGAEDSGTVFRVSLNGGLKKLVSFGGFRGAHPVAGLAQASDGNYYGTTSSGGVGNKGTVFLMKKSGGLTTLINFNGVNGVRPTAKLVQGNDGHLYGVTSGGGLNDCGTIFRIIYPPLFAGLYNGLFNNNGFEVERSGFFRLKVAKSLKFSGRIYLDGLNHALAGQFASNSLVAHVILERTEQPPLDVYFSLLREFGEFKVRGSVFNSNWVAYAFGDRADYSRAFPCPQEGSYAITFQGEGEGITGPNHGSRGIATVRFNGTIRLKGILADDTRIARSTHLSGEGWWPLYVPLYPQNIYSQNKQYRGLLAGWSSFVEQPYSQVQGIVDWIKPAAPSKFFSAGFTNTMAVFGSIRE